LRLSVPWPPPTHRSTPRAQEVWPKEEQNPAGLAAKQKAAIERWAPIVKEAGIKVQ